MAEPTIVKPYPKKLDRKAKVRKLRSKGLTEREIAQATGLSKTAVHHHLSTSIDPLALEDYKKHRADIFASKASTFVHLLDPESAKRIMEKHPTAAALWFNSLTNQERLERGQSTEIHEVHIRGLAAFLDVTPGRQSGAIPDPPVDIEPI